MLFHDPELRTEYPELTGRLLGKPHGEGASLAYLAFKMDLSSVESGDLLNKGEADPQAFGVSEGLCLFLKVACKNLF